jgi:hypothetical protein
MVTLAGELLIPNFLVLKKNFSLLRRLAPHAPQLLSQSPADTTSILTQSKRPASPPRLREYRAFVNLSQSAMHFCPICGSLLLLEESHNGTMKQSRALSVMMWSVVLWCCCDGAAVVLWCCGAVVLWCCGLVILWCYAVAWCVAVALWCGG